MRMKWMAVGLSALALGVAAAQQPAKLSVDTTQKTADVSPTLYGLMTEEINFSYDGGLYAELIRNRTFTNGWPRFEWWRVVTQGESSAVVENGDSGPSEALRKSMKLVVREASKANEAGVSNDGYWGMAVRPSTTYRGSFYAKPAGVGTAHIRLIANQTAATLAETTVALTDGDWKKYEYTLKTGAGVVPGKDNHWEMTFTQKGSIELQLVSLFEPTFNNREHGNRPDLMKMLAAMHPNFLRFPGGNYVEGNTLAEHFDWKKTIGPLVDRPTKRTSWGYTSSDGMGLLEFLEWCEDLKMEPVLAIFAGYTLNGEHAEGEALNPYIAEALDEIEYVTGDASTKWGAIRARDGHPEPFKLRFIEVGNEDNLDHSGSYIKRYPPFEKAIRAKYPQLKLIATSWQHGGSPDLVDDHYYRTPHEFFDLVHTYDNGDRKGPKIFVGEWATRTGSPTPDFGAALGDAAWMTSMERNADLVVMAAYAPLFTNVNPGGMQWSADLIGYDALHSYGSPSYWAQVLFNDHLGTQVAKSQAEGVGNRFFWSATVSPDKKVLYLKLVNASDRPQALTLDVTGAKVGAAVTNTMHAATWYVTNAIDHPETIKPVKGTTAVTAGSWKHVVGPNTIEVIDIPLK
ncbi:MAG: alpha-N-arabinofuranosidase [Acidobacteria bacterium]|nr:alpha-N-arabinofuranosidase [Acidobacteriota bacterium]